MNLIVSENIRLEPTSEKQATQLFEIIDRNRDHLSEFLPWVEKMQTVGNIKEYLRNARLLAEQKMEAGFAIIHNATIVGRIGLHYINLQNKSGAIGYWLSKDAQGQGIILKSCKKLIDYGFRDLGLHRIEIKAAVKNLKSQAIPVKLNFVREGVLRQAEFVNNEFLDLVLYSMISTEWKIEI